MKRVTFIFVCLSFAILCQARIITVDDDGPADFNNIQAAINDANDGDTVIVADGTYSGSGNYGINLLGKAVTVRSQNGPTNCIVDCQAANWPGFYIAHGEGMNSVVEGFTITRGQGEPAGGILTWGSSPTIINNVIKGNYGGAIDCYYGASPKIINNIIVGNGGSGHGGGIYCYGEGSSPLILNNTIADNYEGWHGGIDSTGGASPMIINCILWNNSDNLVGCTATYSCIEDGDKGEGNIDADPCFVKPGYWDPNGVWLDGDYHLLPDSPCIDAGIDAGVYTDIEGNIRPFDYPEVDNNGELPEFDMGAYEAVTGIEVPMKFTPQAINCKSSGKWVKAHFVLPAEFTVEDVDTNIPAKIERLGIESHHINVFINEDGLVEVEAAFERAAFCDAAGCGSIEITVVGLLTDGRYFYGTDTIKIIKNSFECLAVLSSHWLELNCGKPDWCNGFDADRDTTVNLKDFAIMAFHWLEEK